MSHKYMLGCGYHEGSHSDYAFSFKWASNIERWATPKPQLIVTLSTGASPIDCSDVFTCDYQNISCNHNLGHVGHLIHGEKSNQLCGWSASFLGLAMIAYNSGIDYVFQEQDCLAFGDYIGQMYCDLGDFGQMAFGAKMASPPYMSSAQALVLVKHAYIPTMVRNYIVQGPDGLASLPEQKFSGIEEMDWQHVRRLSFGVDRERPIPWESPVWYAQKFSPEELDEAKRRGLL
jgi:hypothetical protein